MGKLGGKIKSKFPGIYHATREYRKLFLAVSQTLFNLHYR